MGILGSLLGRREPVVEYRTIDGGHPAPYPDMTDEQLYNYEVTFNVAQRTFDRPPTPAKPPRAAKPQAKPTVEATTLRREPPETVHKTHRHTEANPETGAEKVFDAPRYKARPEAAQQEVEEKPAEGKQADGQQRDRTVQLPPLDLGKPVRLITTKQPVDIITTRARHPVYKVHAYIGNDDIVTLFTLDGRLSENGPRYLENLPQRQHLFLNIYQNTDAGGSDRYLLTQHASRQEADEAAKPGRLACVPLQFDL